MTVSASRGPALPGTVGGAVAGDGVGGRADVGDASVLLVGGEKIFVGHLFPIGGLGDGVVWNLIEVVIGDEIVERLRGFLLVEGVFPDRFAHLSKFGAKLVFVSDQNRMA